MKSIKRNKLWDVDEQLFTSMRAHYQSDREQEFFEKVRERQLWDCSVSGDLLMSENDNEDRLYIMRIQFDEYEVGNYDSEVEEQHVMNLSEALSLNLKECGLSSQDLTLLQWLRGRDYSGIRYDCNYDNM